MSLATKYRPATLDSVVGQPLIVNILKKITTNRTFKNCILFTGQTGGGKTTLARLLAKAINNNIGEPIEIDAASQNSVDNIRAIIEAANTRALVGEYKIFILDEVHMLSNSAWNAFLKCIEEPPKYTIFIMCTTNPEKIPATILNRTQRFNLVPISATEIKDRLLYICQAEEFSNYEQTCDFISKTCHGCMRDAITTLEQCADFSTDLSLDVAKQIIGGFSYENMFNLTWALNSKDQAKCINIIDSLYQQGQDLKHFIDVYLEFILELNKFVLFKNIDVTNLPDYLASEQNPVVQYTVNIEEANKTFNKLAELLLNIKLAIKYDTAYKATIETYLLKYCWSE